ncbi:tetratricopeptide repeat protein [Sinimarinibacterium flocculans]|uniref:Lipopolysaccharide assembly protein B n=1 Tax=Sinimarinibacterium flocculans TaxID=985250 RepID=A0A318EPX0_9GAMM|nr:tetratricopeptide repeat protein [Sinimarinibacterium flocculans]PXV71536.1 lipopolysaccharide biosynthesis regulator YciM [Sinimarinibacterium flocculans]
MRLAVLDPLFTWLLLPLGLVLGWALARRRPDGGDKAGFTGEQLGGLLTQLSSDDPDQAIAALTTATEIDPSTAELHLTLGRMFRKRGEVDRALRVHEALVQRSGLAPQQLLQARYELAQDYMTAGVMDRAEQLFDKLAGDGAFVVPSLDAIRTIHEQARDWPLAIEAARRLQSAKGESQRAAIAQYFCEMAEEARRGRDTKEALNLARQALDEDRSCVRALLLLAQLHEAQAEYPAAARHYLKAFEHDPRFLPEVIEPLQRCFSATGDRDGYLLFLRDAKEMTSSSLPFVAEARLLAETGMDPLDHLAQGLEARPSRAVLADFLEILERQPNVVAAGLDKPAASLRQALLRLMESTPRYQCSTCGFSPRQMFWQCPGCKQWGTTAPADDVLRG